MKRTKITFPYKIYRGERYPIINILLKGPGGFLETEAYVDTGASISIFLATIATDLGIDYTKGRVTYTMVGDGSFIPVHIHKLTVKVGHISFSSTIGFSTHLGADFNLIGQKDFFDHFKVTFDKKAGFISFQPYR